MSASPERAIWLQLTVRNRRIRFMGNLRRKSAGYVSGTLRYEILKRAKHRCELCGISAELKALEVDHIIPRNKGGTDDTSNFQALCYSCNAMKRDRDDTDFRDIASHYDDRSAGCIFCEAKDSLIVAENELCFAIRDGYPVTPEHSLIIPRRHVANYFNLYQPTINATVSLLNEVKAQIIGRDVQVTGFNVGINIGQDAGQSISHVHVHLIPRRRGDTQNPKGEYVA